MIKYIRKGQKVEEKYCYNFSLLAAVIKSEIVQNNEIFQNDKNIQNIDEYMEKTEDNRLQNVCDFIKQESLKENN